MVERVPNDGRSSFNDISIEGFPPLYVCDIQISLEEVVTRPNLHEHKNLVATEKNDDEAKMLYSSQPHEDLGENESYRSYLDLSVDH